ncbi:hypothetical protein GLW08_14630 [Pontibacillus yanchengensis]|uniref:Uncharacterized protein n=2 Tax=Pontibacillus yanchengensis TaxID=462910 RepID=A0ACC7VGI6_9BACI|nr:YwhD family protein [Pontibacillus yanchengensis]MYL35715.1 hypothetical protein [Pontibacillus yanchengensis]MYL54568.1 hypothetical protein [Pontibacillus yanchengensis]
MSSSDQSNSNKKNNQFTIINDDSTDGHGGYGAGTLSLENISPVFVCPSAGTAEVDMGALHARSQVEKRVKFKPDKSIVPNPTLYWLVWVTVEHNENGPYYAGVAGCEMLVDKENRRGYKSMPEHVNNMDKSMKGKVVVEQMDDESKRLLGEFLHQHSEDMWNNSPDELKQALEV